MVLYVYSHTLTSAPTGEGGDDVFVKGLWQYCTCILTPYKDGNLHQDRGKET